MTMQSKITTLKILYKIIKKAVLKMMFKYQLTIGLFDKDTEKQKIKTEEAKNIIANTLIDKFNLFAFTMIECSGVYKMASTNQIIFMFT